MKISLIVAASFLTFVPHDLPAQAVAPATGVPRLAAKPTSSAAVATKFGKLPLSFEANQGQTDPRVRFLARGQGYSLFLTDSAAVLALTPIAPTDNSAPHDPKEAKAPGKSVETDTMRMELAGADPRVRVQGAEQLPGKINYFVGNDPAKWRTNVPTYAQVKYTGVYAGVDLVYYGNQRQLEYDFVVAPGADPKPVRLHFAGASKLKLDTEGNLAISGSKSRIAFHRPEVYQVIDGHRRSVSGNFELLAGHSVGFSLGSYDHTRELVIDPVLAYSTYLGGSGNAGNFADQANAVAVDSAGNAYVAGNTFSTDFPITANAFETSVEPFGGFVTKLDPTLSTLVYSSYFGGSFTSVAGIAVDSTGAAYLTGSAGSAFPTTPGVLQTFSSTGNSGFVAKVSPDGSSLVYATLLGGNANATCNAIAVDGAGNAYVTGGTSSGFPVTAGAYQSVIPNTASAFVSKLNPTGTALIYSTYLGGAPNTNFGANVHPSDVGYAIAVDAEGHAFVAGATRFTYFPTTPGAFQTVNNSSTSNPGAGFNGFVTKMNEDGSGLDYSTFLGGTTLYYTGDWINAIAVDSSGSAYVGGIANSDDFPVTVGAFQLANHAQVNSSGTNGFVGKLNTGGTALIYSTYLGGSDSDFVSALVIDAGHHVFVTGTATSHDFPVTPGAFQSANNAPVGDPNAFFSELKSDGSALVNSTYLGGHTPAQYPDDIGNGIAVDSAGDVFVAGIATSPDFPVTSQAFQQVNHADDLASSFGETDNAFVTRFSPTPTTTEPTGTTLTADNTTQDANTTITFLAHVLPDNGFGIPIGQVTFKVDGVAKQTVTLANVGYAIYYGSLAAGPHTVVAAYLGTSVHSPSNSDPLNVTILDKAAPPNFSPLGGTYRVAQSVALASPTSGATIYYTTDGSTPTVNSTKYTGPVAISANGTLKAIAALSGGSATASAAVSQTYKIAPSAIGCTTSLESSLNPSVLGQAVTFTASVYAESGSTPTGSVAFRSGDQVLAVVPLSGNTASYTTSSLTPLGHSITAVYTGDATHAEKGSPVLTQEVTP